MRMMLSVPSTALADLSRSSGELSKIAKGYFNAGNESAGRALETTSETLRDLRL